MPNRLARLAMTLASGASMFAVGALVAIGARGDVDGSSVASPALSSVDPGQAVDPTRKDPTLACPHPPAEWLWCDDFESDQASRYFEFAAAGNSLTREPGAGRNGSTSLRARWTQGQVDAGSVKLVLGKNPFGSPRVMGDPSERYRELYWRVFVRSQAGWQAKGNDKFTRAIVFAGADWREAAIGHVWGGSTPATQSYFVIDPATGVDQRSQVATVGYNDFAHLAWLGQSQGKIPLMGQGAGQWHCVEAHMRLNDPGVSNGVLELWVDDVLDAQRSGMNLVGDYATYGINALFLESYINEGAPRAQLRDYDDLVVSTARIGCVDSTNP